MQLTKSGPILIFLILLAFLLRIVNLSHLPNGLHVDELDAGYIGAYIWQNGIDISGKFLPLYYDKFGDFRPTGIFYLSGLTVKILGPNISAIRLPAALAGVFSVPIIYSLASILGISNPWTAAFVLTLMPWHIVLSRATSEGIIGLFVFMLGLIYMLKSSKRKKGKYPIIAGLFFTISYLFYHPLRITVPLILLSFYFLKGINKKILTGLLIGFCLLTIFFTTTQGGQARLNQVIFYKTPLMKPKIESLLANEGPGKIQRARFFHNKAILYSREFISQYFKYFSPEYLFMNGGLPYRYGIPEQGLIYITYFLLMLMGIVKIIKDKNANPLILLMALFITSPVSAALTYEDTPNIHRSLLMIVPVTIIAGAGLSMLIDLFQKHKILGLILTSTVIILICAESVYFWHQYIIHSPSYNPMYRQDGYLDVLKFIEINKNNYSQIYIPGYEHLPLYFLFFRENFNHNNFQAISNDVILDRIDNINFVKTWCPDTNNLDSNFLLIRSGECPDLPGLKEMILRKDYTTAFKIYNSDN